MLSVFITPWMKPTFIHCAMSAAWRSATARSSAEVRARARRRDRGRGARSCSRRAGARARGRRARRRYWNVPTRRWLAATRVSTAPGSDRLAQHRLAGRDDRQRARRRDAERVHRLADQYLAQHRPDRGLAVAAARERRAPRALERDVAPLAVAVDHLAEQQGAAVAELRREAAELVARVGLRDRLGALRHGVAGEDRDAASPAKRVGVEAELLGQRTVEEQRRRRRHRLGRHGTEKPCRSRA